MKRLIPILLLLVSGVADAKPFRLLCEWTTYGRTPTQESFVIYPDKKKVYWVNEDQEGLDLIRVDDGVLEFSAISKAVTFLRSGANTLIINTSDKVRLKNVWLGFSINRLSGEMKVTVNPRTLFNMTKNLILAVEPSIQAPEEELDVMINMYEEGPFEELREFKAVGRGSTWSMYGSCKKVEMDYLG